MKPKVSVIVPVLNRQTLVVRCLESILNQTVRPEEIIIVDNGSTDDTVANVENWIEYNRNKGVELVLLHQPEKGACQARQKGLEYATGDYLQFFDSDDLMLPPLMESALAEIDKNPDSDLICWKCRLHLLDGEQKIPTVNFHNPLENHLVHTLFRPQGYMIRKDFLIKAGGWSKNLKVWNDYELGLRLLLQSPKISGVNKILAEIFSQEDSITGKRFTDKEGSWEVTLDEMEMEADRWVENRERDRIKKILNYRRAILASFYKKEGNSQGAKKLLARTIRNISVKDKLLLRAVYLYTSSNYRGAWKWARFFL